jgi:serine phosphatase RsbU (regulator of sigma subunit)
VTDTRGVAEEAGNPFAGLMPRLLAVYVAALFSGSLFIFMNNVVVSGRTLRQLWAFNIPFVLVGDVMIALALLAISYWRLKPVHGFFHDRRAEAEKEPVFRRLMRFPSELFGGMMLLALVFIVLFHASELVMGHRIIRSPTGWARLLINVVVELGLALLLATLLYSFTRRLCRAYAHKLHIVRVSVAKPQSAANTIAGTAIVCFLIVFVAIIRTIDSYTLGNNTFEWQPFITIAIVYTALATAIFVVSIVQLRQELRWLTGHLQSLSIADKDSLHQTLPVLSLDETGMLVGSLNGLQQRMEAGYHDLERQIKLAYAVQSRILPRVLPQPDGVRLSVFCRQILEVGGDFYDVLELGENRYILAIGDVSGKGLPAALMMSAVMAGLRNEAGAGGGSAEMLARLNRHIFQMTGGKGYTTMALAVLELSDGGAVLDYASAGHMDPYLIRGKRAAALEGSSLPLGIAPDTDYRAIRVELRKGDILAMYTDGMVEAQDADGQMAGFERWEEELGKLAPDKPLEEELQALLDRWSNGGTREDQGIAPAPLQDDRTVLLIRVERRAGR